VPTISACYWQVVPLLQAALQQSVAHPAVVPTVPPVGTQLTHVPTAVLHAGVPPSLMAEQSESPLHSTQVPRMAELLVLPHTSAKGSLAPVHGVPVAAFVKLGPSAPPSRTVQVGTRQALVEAGTLLELLIDVVPPAPLHTVDWQLPAVCSEAGATLLPGYTHAPVVAAQLVAPQAPVVVHAAVQQFPLPAMSQTPDAHWRFAVQVLPAATVESATQVPLAPGFWQKTPVPAQSLLDAHAVLHAVPLAQTKPPAHAWVVPAVQVSLVVLQVAAVVSMFVVLLHDAGAQFASVVQPTHPVAATQPPVQGWTEPVATQPFVMLQDCVGVKLLPLLLHDAAAQATGAV